MPSTSFHNLESRLKDIEQLLAAHTAITKFNKAQRVAEQAGAELRNISRIIDALVTNPGRGRPSEVDALNRAGFVLLCSHLQGFIDDIHLEVAHIVLRGKVASIEETVKLVKPRNSNPHVEVINKIFAGLGIYDLMDKINLAKVF